jgi:hypothetical protein
VQYEAVPRMSDAEAVRTRRGSHHGPPSRGQGEPPASPELDAFDYYPEYLNRPEV